MTSQNVLWLPGSNIMLSVNALLLNSSRATPWKPVQAPMARFPWIVAQQHRTQLLQPWQRLLEEKRRLTAVEGHEMSLSLPVLRTSGRPAGPSSSAENASWRTSKCKPWSFILMKVYFLQGRQLPNDWTGLVCFLEHDDPK